MSEHYGPRFFAQMSACRDAYRVLADCIIDTVLPFASVIDFGCGSGYVIERLKEHGAMVLGVDAFGVTDRVPIARWDLTVPIAFETHDLVICTETAEHLPAFAAPLLVELCARTAARQIVWSAAPPGQGGDGHINEQPAEYWLRQFQSRRWLVRHGHTSELRRRMTERHAQHEFCADSFYVLERNPPNDSPRF